jgi:sulfoxide reductase catalytic subunit YedY
MLIKRSPDIRYSEITRKHLYLNRRTFLAGLPVAGAALVGGKALADDKLNGITKSAFSTTEKVTPYNDVTHYNNYYEFGTQKEQPASLAQKLKTSPWTVKVEGAVNKPQVFDIDAIMKLAPLEERIYVEGLRMDEAMHPLAILCVGMYGEALPKQDGAPVRLVVPWKYGFKSIKSIVKIKFVEKQPPTTWNITNAREYGFYSNVNPEVDHPRRSQAKERRLGDLFMRPTVKFNGYADQVARLYAGIGLKKNF